MTKTTDFWVGDRLVRPSLGEIQSGLERDHLEPRSMEVLLALAKRPGEVIPKEELIRAVWRDAFVSDEVLTHAIWDLRRAFGDNASDPEFIQTIPKRGYRLIAPVKPTGPLRRRATDRQPEAAGESARPRPTVRILVWGATLLTALVAAGFWLAGRTPVEPPAAVAPDSLALVLTPATAVPERSDWGLRLDARLRSELTALERIGIRRQPVCAAAADVERTLCLEPMVFAITDAHQLTMSLKEAGSGEEVYATPPTAVTNGDELDAAAVEQAEQIAAYFRVVRNKYFDDPDIRPWIRPVRNDPRAVENFLLGVAFVYMNETGGRNPMDVAIEQDSGFVAPLVWRTPTIVQETLGGLLPPETLDGHRARLDRLYADADSFEKPMIGWALAFIDGNVQAAKRELKVALGQQQGNRPASFILGVMHMLTDSYDQAWETFAPLLEDRWRFPGLYSIAAQCALCRGRIDDLRATLAIAEQLEPIDPETLALLGLLAAHDGDAQQESYYADRLERRKAEMAPENVEIELSCTELLRESAD